MAFDYTINPNAMASGFQAGQAIGQGLRGAFKDKPAMQEALDQIAQGANPQQVIQQLSATNPQAAQMLMEQMQQQYQTQAAPIAIEQAQLSNQQVQQNMQRQQQFQDITSQGEFDPKTIRLLAAIDPEQTNQIINALNATDGRVVQYAATNLLGAASMTNMDAQTRILNDVANELGNVSPGLSAQIKEIAEMKNPQERGVALQSAIKLIGEGGFVPNSNRKRVQSTQAMDGGTMVVYTDGTTEFKEYDDETQQALKAYQDAQVPKLSAALEKRQIEASTAAQRSRSELSKIDQLISGFEQLNAGGGAKTRFDEFVKTQLGDEDAETMLRTNYRALRNSQAVNNLPPGVASDKDIELALSGFPSDNASPEFIASWLRGVRKLEQNSARYNEFLSRFIALGGNTEVARRNFNIDGVEIKKGETVRSAYRKFLESQGLNSQQQPQQTETRDFESEYGVN